MKTKVKLTPRMKAMKKAGNSDELALVVPDLFAKKVNPNERKAPKTGPKAKKDLAMMSLQEQRNAISKREASKFKWALKTAPQDRMQEYEAIMANEGPGRLQKLKEWKAKYFVDGNWADTKFEETVENHWSQTTESNKGWISYGRLQKLLGKAEAAIAVKNRWYEMRAGKHPGQLEIRYEEEKLHTSDGVSHTKGLKASGEVEEDVVQDVFDQLLQQTPKMQITGSGSSGSRQGKGSSRGGSRPDSAALAIQDREPSGPHLKRPAAAPTLPGPAPAAPKKQATKEQGAQAKSYQLEATNGAVKTAYSKVAALKVDLAKEKGRMQGLTFTKDRDVRLKTAVETDLQECIDSSQDYVSELLTRVGSKQSMDHMKDNITYLQKTAIFMADCKEVQDRAKKLEQR